MFTMQKNGFALITIAIAFRIFNNKILLKTLYRLTLFLAYTRKSDTSQESFYKFIDIENHLSFVIKTQKKRTKYTQKMPICTIFKQTISHCYNTRYNTSKRNQYS